MKSHETKIKETAELIFEQTEYYEIYNTKNRFSEKWVRPVNKEIVDTLLNTLKFKVAFKDKDGQWYLNY